MGLMGSRMAARLLAASHGVTVYNRTRAKALALVDKGARAANTPAEAAEAKEICFTDVADGSALKSVVLGPDGVIRAATPPKIIIDMATIAVADSVDIAAALAEAGVAYLRAPVSGSTGLAEAGKLTIVTSGDKAIYEAVEPYLAVLGENRYYVGTGEEARYVKLIHQLMIGATVQALAEGIVLGEKAGIDRALVLEVLGNSAVASPYVKFKSAGLIAKDYRAAMSLANQTKDADLVIAAAESVGAHLPAARTIAAFFREAVSAGWGERDATALVLALEQMAGLDPVERVAEPEAAHGNEARRS
jgi:3-hydroxyisobutyrate dehydrogenase-like beta-hydroxyacid dehydrogenase